MGKNNKDLYFQHLPIQRFQVEFGHRNQKGDVLNLDLSVIDYHFLKFHNK